MIAYIWSSYKSKYGNNNVPLNCVISTDSDSKLDALAKKLKTTKNRTVELLINKQYNKELKQQKKGDVQGTRTKLSDLFNSLHSKEELRELKKEFNSLKSEKNKIVRQVCELTVLIANKTPTKLSLNDEQKCKANEMYKWLVEDESQNNEE